MDVYIKVVSEISKSDIGRETAQKGSFNWKATEMLMYSKGSEKEPSTKKTLEKSVGCFSGFGT